MRTKLPTPSPGEPILADHIRKLSAAVRRLRPMTSSTVRVQETANGVAFHTFPTGGASGTFKGAWAPTLQNGGNKLKLTPGSINDGITTFTPVVDDISLNAGLNYVYLRCGVTRTTEDGYVVGGTITSAIIEVTTSAQVSDTTYGRVLLCTINRATTPITITRYQWFNLSAQIRTSPYFYYWVS